MYTLQNVYAHLNHNGKIELMRGVWLGVWLYERDSFLSEAKSWCLDSEDDFILDFIQDVTESEKPFVLSGDGNLEIFDYDDLDDFIDSYLHDVSTCWLAKSDFIEAVEVGFKIGFFRVDMMTASLDENGQFTIDDNRQFDELTPMDKLLILKYLSNQKVQERLAKAMKSKGE